MSPKFNKTTQAKLIPALAAIHNFCWLNDSVEEEEVWDPDNEDGSNASDPFLVPEPFQGHHAPSEPTVEDLSVGITEEETVWADAHWDEIAAQMWASYQAHLAQI